MTNDEKQDYIRDLLEKWWITYLDANRDKLKDFVDKLKVPDCLKDAEYQNVFVKLKCGSTDETEYGLFIEILGLENEVKFTDDQTFNLNYTYCFLGVDKEKMDEVELELKGWFNENDVDNECNFYGEEDLAIRVVDKFLPHFSLDFYDARVKNVEFTTSP